VVAGRVLPSVSTRREDGLKSSLVDA
jgi:hypothetical protein